MAVMEWDPARFDVGVAKMNQEHEGLVRLMNQIHDRNQAKAPKAELAGMIDRLAGLTVKHFADEEAYLESVAFPELRTHKAIHAKLLADFTRHKQAFDAGPGSLGKDFFDFLSLWLRSHICHLDMKYNPVAKARKAV
ncbi:MAG: hemerythrin family protein [Steroidobacteraceae bacterium]